MVTTLTGQERFGLCDPPLPIRFEHQPLSHREREGPAAKQWEGEGDW